MEKFCLDCESKKKCQIGSRRRRASADVVARAQALSPGRRRRRPSVEVWGVGEKTPLPRGTRRRTGADVVARAHAYVVARTQALSPGRRRCCPDADVVARVLKFRVLVKKHPSRAAPVVAWAQTLSPARMRCRPRACVLARAQAFLPGRTRRRTSEVTLPGSRRLWSPDDASARAQALSPAPAPSAPEPQKV